jgi:hypothetical protein
MDLGRPVLCYCRAALSRPSTLWMSVGLVVGLVSACGDDDGAPAPSCEPGTLRCECRAEDECDVGLTCLSGVCVRRNGGSAAGGASPAGAAGESSNEGGAPSGGRGGTSSGGAAKGGANATGGTTPSGDDGGSAGAGAVVNGDGGALSAGAGGASSAVAGEGGGFSAAGAPGEGGASASGGASATGGTSPSTGGTSPTGGAGSSGEETFSDDFEDGDTTGWSATSWRVFSDGGNQVFRQNPAYSGQTTPARAASSVSGDRRMEVRFKFTQVSSLSFAVIGADFETADNRDQIMVDTSGSGTLLHARNGTTTTDTFTASIAVGTWYSLALEIDGTTLRGYFDGALVAELTNVTGIQSGVALTANQTGDVYYDDVSVCAGSDC